LLKKAAKLGTGKKPGTGSKTTGRGSVGQVTKAQCAEIAKVKMKDLNANDIEAATKIIMGSARSIGITVVE
jgi:large subunit ribosomal protein L11